MDRKGWPVFRDDEGLYALCYTWNTCLLQHTHLTIIPLAEPTAPLAIRPTWRPRQHWISARSATSAHPTILPA